jgi:DNA helicase-2/ATP-dependent DNA helicase PcrA
LTTNYPIGNIVIHDRFGKGKVIYIEGVSDNQKAEILFEKVGTKKVTIEVF